MVAMSVSRAPAEEADGGSTDTARVDDGGADETAVEAATVATADVGGADMAVVLESDTRLVEPRRLRRK